MKKYYIVCATLLILTTGCFEKKSSSSKSVESSNLTSNIEEKTETNSYTAYLNFGPTLKLEYQQVCKVKGTEKNCENPTVTSVELVNESSKKVFANVDLLASTKELSAVLNNIYTVAESKGTKVSSVSIQSDWDGLNNYITTSANSNTTYKKVSSTVTKTTKEQIATNITTDLNNEAKAKAEAEAKAKAEAEAKAKAEAEAKAKAEAEAKKKAEEAAKKKAQEEAKKKAEEEAKRKAEAEKKAQTIYLKDNVKYGFSEESFQNTKAFSTSLINSLKNTKGYYLANISSDKKTIAVRYITILSGKYNTTTYKGNGNLKSQIIKEGGENIGGLGSVDETLTKAICTQYHLICE